jgi:hypothetical protein
MKTARTLCRGAMAPAASQRMPAAFRHDRGATLSTLSQRHRIRP